MSNHKGGYQLAHAIAEKICGLTHSIQYVKLSLVGVRKANYAIKQNLEERGDSRSNDGTVSFFELKYQADDLSDFVCGTTSTFGCI